MKAARIISPKQFEFVDVDMPVLGNQECLIQLKRWSICGTDMRADYSPTFDEKEYPLGIGDPCHEMAGVVVESNVDTLKTDDLVIVFPRKGGHGGFVEYITAYPSHVAKIPSGGDLAEWLMCQPAATVLEGCKKINSFLGKKVVILGQGPIGLCFTAMISKLGALKVVAVDSIDYRLKYAKQFGATNCINYKEQELKEIVRDITDGNMADIVIDAAGSIDSFQNSTELICRTGTLVLFGIQEWNQNKYLLDTDGLNDFIRNEINIISVGPAGRKDPMLHVREMISLKNRGWWDPSILVTHNMLLTEINEAFSLYENQKDNVLKIVMK